MKFKILLSLFGKHPMLAIHEVDEKGEVAEKDTIKFGLKKAKAILASVEQIKKFVETEGKES